MSNNSTPFGQTPIDLSSTSGGVSRGSASLGQARVAIEAIKHHIISHNVQRLKCFALICARGGAYFVSFGHC